MRPTPCRRRSPHPGARAGPHAVGIKAGHWRPFEQIALDSAWRTDARHHAGSDGGRWPEAQWRREVTELVSVGQMRDIEFTAVPGDWALHCRMAHHTMNAMGHVIPNPTGVDQSGVEARVRKISPSFTPMARDGMAEHQEHTDAGHQGPVNTMPMMVGKGPFGNVEMGGMFTLVKVRDDIAPGDYADPGFYGDAGHERAKRISTDPNFGAPPRRPG